MIQRPWASISTRQFFPLLLRRPVCYSLERFDKERASWEHAEEKTNPSQYQKVHTRLIDLLEIRNLWSSLHEHACFLLALHSKVLTVHLSFIILSFCSKFPRN